MRTSTDDGCTMSDSSNGSMMIRPASICSRMRAGRRGSCNRHVSETAARRYRLAAMFLPRHFTVARSGGRSLDARPVGPGSDTLWWPVTTGSSSTPMPFVVDDRPRVGAGAPRSAEPGVARTRRVMRSLIVPVSDAYISPSWYPSKVEVDGKVVPTWNYEVVHLHGRLTCRTTTPDWVLAVRSAELTDLQEASSCPTPGRSTTRLGRLHREADSGASSGSRSRSTRVDAKRKLSQNRTPEDRAGVIGRSPFGRCHRRCGGDVTAIDRPPVGQMPDGTTPAARVPATPLRM